MISIKIKRRFSIKILLTRRKLHGILFLMKNGNYLKANLLKGRDAKPEVAKISMMLKKYSRDAGRFWKVSFFVCKNG